MNRLLTITIPAYNSEKYLARCLNSLLSCEACRETELLVIDDGSTDGTGRIADAYARRYPEIVRVIHKENGGHGSGINAGIAAAQGKYFRVVDSDDAVDPAAYREYLRRLKDIASDLIATPFVCVTEERSRAAKKLVEKSAGVAEGGRRFKKSRLQYMNREENGSEPKERKSGRKAVWRSLKRNSGKQKCCEIAYMREIEGAAGLPRGEAFLFEAAARRLHVRMHEMTIRTSILKEHSIRMSEHSFYVDMQYISFPIPWIRTCCILDLPVYRYRLGSEGQSVSAGNMQKNRGQHQEVLRSLVRFYKERERAGDSGARLAYLARSIAKMQANQVQTILSLPVGRAAKRELCQAERWLRRECPAAYAANEKKSLRVLRGSGYALYPVAAAVWRIMKCGRVR
ncbi:MAG: glycosyltransferase family 2 protein [Lachnospiraceae bacterium]|nr:glycosyltransferase family 2 protein [Lachnospiraceae bacterium]